MRISDWSSDVCSSDLATFPKRSPTWPKSQLGADWAYSGTTPTSCVLDLWRARKDRKTLFSRFLCPGVGRAAPTREISHHRENPSWRPRARTQLSANKRPSRPWSKRRAEPDKRRVGKKWVRQLIARGAHT